MESWYRSDITDARMEGLVKCSLLRGRTDAMEWLVPGCEEVPMSPDSYIISFAPFHEHRLVIPPHPFFQGLLHHSAGRCLPRGYFTIVRLCSASRRQWMSLTPSSQS